MAMVLMNLGALDTLDALRATWLPSLRIGLFQNDWNPVVGDTLAAVVPATFSGYTGLHFLPGWSSAALSGDLAVSEASPRLWTHNGGPVGNWIFGYYVCTLAGRLEWAERDPQGGKAVDELGGFYSVVPVYTVQSRFQS